MATTTAQGVDVGALAAAIKAEVSDRLGIVLSGACDALEDAENRLNMLQQSTFIEWTIETFDGLERKIAQTLVDDLTRNGIEVWGLPTNLADLIPEDGDDG